MKKNRFINKVILLLSIAFTFLITSSTAQPLIVGQINPRSLNVPCGYTGYPLVLTFQNTYAYINNFNDVNHLPSFLRPSAGLLAWYPFAYTNTNSPTSSWRIDRTGVNNQIFVGAATSFLGLNATLATPSTDRFVNGIANYSGTNYNSAAAQFQIGLTNSIPSSSQYFMNSLTNANSNKGTISFWFNMSHSSLFLQNRGVFEMWDSTSSAVKMQVWNGKDTVTGNEDTLYVHHALFGSGNTVPLIWSNIASAGNNWVHFSMAIDAAAGTAKFYLNGIFQKSYSFTPVTSTNIFGNYYQFGRVAHANGFNNIGAFSGLIDDITFYNRNLNDYENTILFKGWRVKWDNNDSTQTRLVLPPSTAVTKYTCEVYTSNANTYYKDSIIAQFIKPQPYVYPNPASVCIGSTIRLYADDSVNLNPFYWNTTNSQNQSISPSSGTGMYRKWFRWNASNGTVDSLTTKLPNGHLNFDYLDITPTLVGTDSIYIQEWNGYSCDSISRRIPLTTKALPTISSATTSSVCSGSTFAYTITSPQAGATFTWVRNTNAAINGGAVSNGTSASISEVLTSTSPAPVVITYTIYANFNGCTSNPFTLSVTVNPKPVLASSLSVLAQNNTAFTYTASSATANTTYTWTRALVTGISNAAGSGSGAVINETLVNTTTNPINVTYIYTLTANGCPNPQNVVVSVRPLPVLSSVTTTNACTGTAFTYTATSATTGTTYTWTRAVVSGISNTAGSGTGAINETLINTTSSPIVVTYNYVLTANGLSNPQTLSVTVNPSISVSASATTLYQGSTSTLTSSVTGTGFTYQWYNNGTLIAGATAATYSATASGNYTIVVNTGNCAVTSSATTITVNTIPTPTVSAGGPTTFCAGANVVLSTTVMAGMTYQWYSNGTIISGATSSTYTATTAANYTVKYINGAASSTLSTATTVTVNALPSATITPSGATTLTQGSSVTLNAVTGANLSYQWNLNGTAISGATSSSYVVTSSVVATLNYTVTVTNTVTGCPNTTSTPTVVTYGTIGTPSINNGASPTTFCQGGSVTLTATSIVAGYTYQWYNNGTAIAGATAATYAASVSGSFSFTQTNGGVTSSFSNAISVTVNTPATATATAGGSTTFYQGSNVSLSVNTSAGFTYQWYNNGTVISGATAATYTATTTANYTVKITNTNGCISNASNAIAVTVNTIPTPTVSAGGPTTFCAGANVVLSTTVMAGMTYQWYSNGTIISGATSSTYTATTAANYTVKYINGAASSTLSTATTVTVNALPSATITPSGATTLTQGSSVTLNAVTGANLSYQWNLNGTAISGATSSSYVVTSSVVATLNYTVTVTNTVTGCPNTTSTPTVVTYGTIGTPSINNGASPTTFCQGGSVTLTATSIVAGYTYQWYNNGTAIAGATAATYAASVSGSFSFTQTNGGVTSSFSNAISVTVNTPATATATAGGPTTFLQGSNVTLTSNTGTGFAYQWYNSTTLISGATSASFTATTSGSFNVRITDANGCISNASNTIFVNVTPVNTPTITANGPTTFCPGGNVILSSNIVVGVNYQWNLNGVAIAGATAATYQAVSAGIYTVTQTNGAYSTTSVSTSVAISTVNATISAGGATTFFAGSNVSLTANTGAGYTYQWYNNGTTISGATNNSFSASISGSYTVTITNALLCASTSSATVVTVNPIPTPTISASGPTTFCSGANVSLSAVAQSGMTYQWFFNSIAISGATSATYTATSTGSYTFTQTNGSVTSSISNTISVTANALPNAIITAGGPTSFVNGGNVSLSSTFVAGVSYQWYNGTLPIAGATTNSFSATMSGNYTLQITSTANCPNTSNVITVAVGAIPTPTISAGGPTTYCNGDSVTLTATVVSGFTYQWYNNGMAISGATATTIKVFNAGSYTFVQTNGAASSSPSLPINITVNSLPSATVTPGGPTTFYNGSNVILTSNTGAGFAYQWYNGTTLISGATSATYMATVSGSYTIKITNSFGCFTYSTPVAVTVNAVPTPVIVANGPTTFCTGANVVLSVTTYAGFTYQWYSNGVAISGAISSSFSATTSSSYTVVQTNGTVSSTMSSATTVTVNTLPTSTISAGGSITFYQGSSVTLSANIGTGLTYQWYQNSTTVITGATSSSFAATTTASYTVVVTNANGCSQTSNIIAVTANTIPTPVITANGPTTFCQGGSVMYTATVVAGMSYQWYNNGVAIAGATTTTFTASASGNYTFTQRNGTVTSAVSNTQVCTVHPLPIASISAGSATTFYNGSNVVLTAVTGIGYVYQWYANGLPISGANTNTYIATTTASYYVVVTSSVTTCVSANSNTISVSVINLPTPVLTAGGPTTFCSGDSVVFSVPTIPSLPNVQYAWKWNGNIITTNFNSFYVATQPGVYTVEYVNGLVYSNTSNTLTITVNPLPIVPAITSNAPLCVGGSLSLGNNVPLGVTYAWTGPNGFASTLSNPTKATTTMLDSGRYYLTITNTTTGCKNTNNANIIVSAYPNATILNTTLSYCEGSSLVLNANTGANLTYQWYNGTNAIFNAINTNYTVTQPGTYAVIVKNQYNCSTTSAPKTVIQIPLPVAVITAVNTNTICEGDTAFMSTPAGVGYSYEWYKSNVFMPGFTTSLAYATTAAFYQVKVTANGCSRTSVLYGVVVHSLTKPVIVQNGNLLSTQAYATYQWSLNGLPIPGANGQSIMINQMGNYTVKVSSFGCFDSSNVYAFTTGVNTIQQNAIYAAPNPTTGKFVVYGLSASNIEVYNMFGALVKSIENSNEIDLSSFAQGIYTIRLFDDKHQLRHIDKIMKQD